MTETDSHLRTTSDAYDSIATRYAEFARDALDDFPLDRAVLAAFAEYATAPGGGVSIDRREEGGAERGRGAGLVGAVPGGRVSIDRREEGGAERGRDAGLVAELGCGPGYVTAHLRDLGLDVFGIDLSASMIDIAREAFPDLRFEVGSMDALSLADGELGGIVSWYSIIHAPPVEIPSYLAEFRRVLRTGGTLLLAFFEAEDGPVAAFDHKVVTAYRWPIDDLARLAGEAGFEEIGRMLRQPADDERQFRRGHLLMRAR